MIREWLEKRRRKHLREIAAAVANELRAEPWGKFLPPVALRDCLYIMSENGRLYRMHDDGTGMELITRLADLH